MSPESPIRAILGVVNAANPFDVLGLPVGPITESDVIDALGERMVTVGKHPLSETPEGNEVRLALHAAAAQLLDASIRKALLDRAGVSAAAPRQPLRPRSPSEALGPRALMVIASEGGWNPRAMRRVAMLAHAEGIPSSAVPRAVRDLAGESVGNRNPSAPGREGRVPRRVTPVTTGEDGPGVATIATAVVSIALLALTWLILDARSRGAVDVSQAPATTAPDGRAAAVEAAPADPISEPPLEQAQTRGSLEADAPDWSAALIGIRDSRTAADADTVGRVIESIGEIWFQTDTGEIRRLATAFVDIVYLMEPNEAASLMADLADGIRGNDPSVAAFNAGLLSRLSIERSLATVVDNSVVAAIVSTIGTAQPVGDELFAQEIGRAHV